MTRQTLTDLAVARLRDVLDYDPETGLFVWKKRTGPRSNPGSIAGVTKKDRGYVEIRVDGRTYKAHRLAWLYVHGRWPSGDIDHINMVTSDNRICNLREATRSQNCCNKRPRRDSRAGIKGVCWYKQLARWVAQIRIRGESHHLGYFHTIEEAAKAYEVAARKFHGEFAPTE